MIWCCLAGPGFHDDTLHACQVVSLSVSSFPLLLSVHSGLTWPPTDSAACDAQLVYMVLYLEHCIKYGLTAEYNLDKIGAGDLMSQLIQFMQTFVLDAHEGMAREGATADAQARGKNKDLGGWASQVRALLSL